MAEMRVMTSTDILILVASHDEPIYRELEAPYLEVCAVLSRGIIHGYKHYVEPWPDFIAHPESLSEIIILLQAGEFFNDRNQIGLNHYRRIFSLDPKDLNNQNYTQDLRARYSRAGSESQFLQDYSSKIVIPFPMDVRPSVYDHFISSHPPLEEAFDTACSTFNENVRSTFGIIDSKLKLKNTSSLYAWNMWIGSPEFYNEWVSLLLPVLKVLDEMSPSLPNDGYQYRWGGFISERLFTVYINLCRETNRWNFVERPVIFFDDTILTERDTILTERDTILTERDTILTERDTVAATLERVLKSKSWTTTRFLRVGDKFLKRVLFSRSK
jgi:hypothetical protein